MANQITQKKGNAAQRAPQGLRRITPQERKFIGKVGRGADVITRIGALARASYVDTIRCREVVATHPGRIPELESWLTVAYDSLRSMAASHRLDPGVVGRAYDTAARHYESCMTASPAGVNRR